ncbi:MAG: hypothetical protein M1514_03000 [Patescibacteria group bacterium]|nr:hypothetical protein [Patescibacteria group bacterium]
MNKLLIQIEPKKASDLVTYSTTTSGISSEFAQGKFPLYYHTYHPENAFVAVPPDFLITLAEGAGETKLAIEIKNSLNLIRGKKEETIRILSQKAKKRLAKK